MAPKQIDVVVSAEEIIKTLLNSEGKEVKQAKQFFIDQFPWPEGVRATPAWQDGPVVYFILTPDGVVLIQSGDWVVQTTEDENYYVRIQNETVE